MAEENKGTTATAPAEKSAERVEKSPSTDKVSDSVVADSQRGVAGAAQNDAQSLNQFANNLAVLNPGVENGRVKVDNPDPYKGVKGPDGLALSAPPTLGDAPVVNPAAATDGAKLPAPDGKIDLPAKKPEGMSDGDYQKLKDQVEAMNRNLADKNNGMTDQQRADLERSTEQLINGKNLDGSDRKPPLNPAETAKVLEQANRMFENTAAIEQKGLTKSDRNIAVADMVHDIANPQDANQGLNNTCNVSAAAKVEMMTNPSAGAERFVNMYVNNDRDPANGNMLYTEVGGKKVYYDVDSIRPDREAQYTEANQGSGARGAYMQGLNHLYVNAVTQERGIYYTDGKPEFNGDTGERQHLGSFNGEVRKRADGTIENSPSMVAEDVQNLMNKIGAGKMAADYNRFGVDPNNNGGVINVEGGNAASLDAAWKANGGKPMVIAVDTNAAMFQNVDGGGKTKGGGHVVTIMDQRVNPETGETEYLMMNQWGRDKNGWVSSTALASAMNPNNPGGDRSGQTLKPDPAGSGENWSSQTYRRPGQTTGGGDGGKGNATSGEASDGSNYGQDNAPRRDPGGIKTGEERNAEMEYRKMLEDAAKQKLEEEEAKRRAENKRKQELEDERLEQERLRKLKNLGGDKQQ